MSHNKIILVIDVTSLLRLWSCHINHNISATQMQPYGTDGRTDGQTHQYTRFAWAGGTFFQLCCCVSVWFWWEIGFGVTYLRTLLKFFFWN